MIEKLRKVHPMYQMASSLGTWFQQKHSEAYEANHIHTSILVA